MSHFLITESRATRVRREAHGGPMRAAEAERLTVVGGLFHGEVRHLNFDDTGALLVVAAFGVRRLDPATLVERDRWLTDRHVHSVHPCGARLWVVAGRELYLSEYGAALGEPIANLEVDAYDTFAVSGTLFAALHERGAVVFDAATGARETYTVDAPWFDGSNRSSRALLSPSGRLVGVRVGRQRGLAIWDRETGAQRLALEHADALAILDDTRAIQGDRDGAATVDLATGALATAPGSGRFGDVLVRGDHLLFADRDGGFDLARVDGFEPVAHLESRASGAGVFAVRVCAALSATHVATYAADAGVLRVTEIGGGTVESPDWSGAAESLSVSRRGDRAAVYRTWSEGRLECVDLTTGALVEVRDPETIAHGGITGDGRGVVLPCGSNLRGRTVFVGDFGAAARDEAGALKSLTYEFVSFGDDGYAISTYTLGGGGHVGLYRVGAKRALGKLEHEKEPPWRFAIGPNGDEALVAWDSATVLYDVTKRPKAVRTYDFGALAVALGPPGFLACKIGSDRLLLSTPRGEVEVTRPRRAHAGVERLAFSRDGELVFVGTLDGVLEVRRTEDGALLRELPLHLGAFTALQPCGDELWTMGDDGVIHIVGAVSRPSPQGT